MINCCYCCRSSCSCICLIKTACFYSCSLDTLFPPITGWVSPLFCQANFASSALQLLWLEQIWVASLMAEVFEVSPSSKCHQCPRNLSTPSDTNTFGNCRHRMSRLHHPPVVPYQAQLQHDLCCSEDTGVVLKCYSQQPEITQIKRMCLLFTLFIKIDSHKPLKSWLTVLVFSVKKEDVWTQSWSIHGALVSQEAYWPSSSSKLYFH